MLIKAWYIYEDDISREEVKKEQHAVGSKEEFESYCSHVADWIHALARRFNYSNGSTLTRIEITDGTVEIANFQSNNDPREAADWIRLRKWMVESG